MKTIGTFDLGCGAILQLKVMSDKAFVAMITQRGGRGCPLSSGGGRGIVRVPGVAGWGYKVKLCFLAAAIPGLRKVLDAAETMEPQ